MRTWRQLISLTEIERSRIDIVEIHAVCADGLPGAEDIDLISLEQLLDQWTSRVREGIKRREHLFACHPERFMHSHAYFSMMALVSIVQGELGVTATDKLNGE